MKKNICLEWKLLTMHNIRIFMLLEYLGGIRVNAYERRIIMVLHE